MAASGLRDMHLADLHDRARELGIEGYRLLGRDELIAAIAEAGGEEPPPPKQRERRERSGREPRSRGGRGRARDDDEGSPAEPEEDEEAEQVTGILDITPRGHGFIRLDGLEAAEGDVYVSPSQIRRCELERGDEVSGPARQPRRGERHPALVHIDTVNGVEPGGERPRFEDLTPVQPTRRIPIDAAAAGSPDAETLVRALDLLNPLAFGQRVLVSAAPGSGRTTLMRALARTLVGLDGVELVVLLVDERPEEEPLWREQVPDADLAIAGAELRSGEQLRLVELALSRATRHAEAGADVVLLVDSLSRIAVAADDPSRAKPLFAAGRESADEGAGSLTVIATTLEGAEDEGGVQRALETTETSLLALSAELAAAGVYPAIDASASRVTGEEQLRSEEEMAGARELRSDLEGLPPAEAAARLRELVGKG